MDCVPKNDMKFKAKKSFNWSGVPISFNSSSELEFHKENGWIKGEIYEGQYYDGGVRCPVAGYFINDSSGKRRQIFTMVLAEPQYLCVYDYFDFNDPEHDHTRRVWNFCYRCNRSVFNLLEENDNPMCPYCNDYVLKEKNDK